MRAKTITKYPLDSPFQADYFMGDRLDIKVNIPALIDMVTKMITDGLMYRYPDPMDLVETLEDCVQVTAVWPSRDAAEMWAAFNATNPMVLSREIVDIEN